MQILAVATVKPAYNKTPLLGDTIRGFVFLWSSKPVFKMLFWRLFSHRLCTYTEDMNVKVTLKLSQSDKQ